jgi:transposase-like protein
MNAKHKSYDKIAKVRAVRRVIQEGHCPHRVAAELDVMAEQVHDWISRYTMPVVMNSCRLRLKTPIDELHEFRKQVESLRHERDLMEKLNGKR